MSKIFERNPDTGQIRSRDIGDYGNEIIIKEEINKEIPNWLIELVKEQPNNMELGEIVRAKVNQKDKDFSPKGKPSEDGDYWFTKSWFSKDNRKQRG